MSDPFAPRTVIVVALASLVAGFVTVFGGGLIALRGRGIAPPPPLAPSGAAHEAEAPTTYADPIADASNAPEESDAALANESDGATDDVAAPPSGGAVTLSPSTVSRCFAGMAPVAITGARCDRLPALDQHFASRSPQIAACAAGGHGRLTFIMDFRFSTQHVSAWGGPASTIPNAGIVSLCVRRATAPLPLTSIPHANDRYIVSVPIEW